MQGVTLTFALIVSLLAVTQRPAYALAAYITSLIWYPSFLVLSMGTVDMPASRIVVAVLLLRCLFDDNIRTKFTWSRLDTFVASNIVIFVAVPIFSDVGLLSSVIENRFIHL